MNEIWKPIEDYLGYYEVSNYGNVRSLKRKFANGRILKPATNKYGYLQVGLCFESKLSSYTVHSLVAKAFIPNPENRPTVNHKDGIKSNCHYLNLEWATKSEQAIHSLRTGLRVMPENWKGKFGSKHGASKYVIKLSMYDEYICEYGSMIEAANINNIDAGQITNVCKGNKKTAGGFKWKYKAIVVT